MEKIYRRILVGVAPFVLIALYALSWQKASAQVVPFPAAGDSRGTNVLARQDGTWISDDGRACQGFYATNMNGSALSSGTAVGPSLISSSGVVANVAASSNTIGAVQDASCANSARCFIGQSGICAWLVDTSTTVSFGQIVYTGQDAASGRVRGITPWTTTYGNRVGVAKSSTTNVGDVTLVYTNVR